MERHAFPGHQVKGLKNPVNFLPVCDQKGPFPGSLLRLTVKPQIERLTEYLGQPFGKIDALGDNFNQGRCEGIAIEQNAEGLSHGTAPFLNRVAAQFLLDIGCKGHGVPSYPTA